GEGLHASSKGARVRFEGKKRTVIDGPFAEAKELIAGFWLWQVKSKEEAIEWLKRAPFDGGTEVEVRQVFEAADFGGELTPEVKERDERLRSRSRSRLRPKTVAVLRRKLFAGRNRALICRRCAKSRRLK